MEKDYKKIAETLIQKQLRIKPRELVDITGGIHNRDFIEEIAVAVRKAGGFPLINIVWESLSRRLVDEVPDEFLSDLSPHLLYMEELIDCHISVAPFQDPALLADINREKSALRSKAMRPVQEASVKRGARRIGIGYPTPEQARMYGIDFTTFDNAFWRAVGADTEKIFNLCDRIRQFLQKGDAVKIISAPGVELNFRIGDRRINRDDGVICDEDLASGDRTANLPFGEVYVAPLEETVCGEVLYPVVYCKAQEVKNLRLRFENGRLVHSSAESNHELFSESFSRNTGDKDRIGEFGIGTNHEVSGVTGCVLLDEKIFGSVHLALGENRSYGGVNSSDLHWDMVIPKPEVYIDGQLFLKDGKFMV